MSKMSSIIRKPDEYLSLEFPESSYTDQAVQPHKMVRGLKCTGIFLRYVVTTKGLCSQKLKAGFLVIQLKYQSINWPL